MRPEAAIVICTRSDSKRVPGKPHQKIAGVPALAHILERMSGTWPIILAVPEGCDEFYTYGKAFKDQDLMIYMGESDSPLHRMAAAIRALFPDPPEYVIRVTHDDILIDKQTMQELFVECRKVGAGYGISPGIVEGAGVEVIRWENLARAAATVSKAVEHVSYFVKDEPFAGQVHMTPREAVARSYRLTFDYPEDQVVLEAVLRAVGPFAPLEKVCEWVDAHAYVLRYNALPEVSVYTCVRNGARWINEAIASVRSQFVLYEHIIVDDASDDGTLDQVLRNGHDRNIRIFYNEKRLGLASSSNLAISKARAPYILRLDADDYLAYGALRKILDQAKKTGAQVVYPDYEIVDENCNLIGRGCGQEHHHAGGALMETRAVNEIRFKDDLMHWDSLELYNRMKDGFGIEYLPEPLFYYRRHPASLSNSDPEDREKALKEIAPANRTKHNREY